MGSKRAIATVDEPEIEETPRARTAAIVLGVGLALLIAARAAFSFVPSMWMWGFNLMRFLPAPLGWALWALAAFALSPTPARRMAPVLARAGAIVRRSSWRGHVAFAVIASLATWFLPDQTHYVGDFQIRLGAAAGNFPTDTLFPQALPLDLYLHHTLPHLLAGDDPLRVVTMIRVIDSIEAAALAIAAVMFARALELRGIAVFAAACVALFGGALGLFTGYGKAFTELCVLTTLVGAFGLRVARHGRGWIALGVSTALAFTLHRSAVALLIPAVAAWQVGLARVRDARAAGEAGMPGGGAAPWKQPAVLVGIALPIATLLAMGPRIAAAMRSVDRAHFLPDAIGQSAVFSAAIAPVHLADVVNLVALLSPLALIAPALAWLRARGARAEDRLFFFALVLPFIGMLLFIHPRQGVFRDWDVFAAAGVALSLATAWLVGETLAAAPRHAWLGVGVALGAIAPTAQWLVHEHRPVDGMLRVAAYVTQPPLRPERERALSYSYASVRNAALGRRDAAAEAAGRAATLAPSLRLLLDWANAEADRDSLRRSQAVLQQLVEKAPTWTEPWIKLGRVSFNLADYAEARRAAERVLALHPDDADARELLERTTRAEGTVAPAH